MLLHGERGPGFTKRNLKTLYCKVPLDELPAGCFHFCSPDFQSRTTKQNFFLSPISTRRAFQTDLTLPPCHACGGRSAGSNRTETVRLSRGFSRGRRSGSTTAFVLILRFHHSRFLVYTHTYLLFYYICGRSHWHNALPGP